MSFQKKAKIVSVKKSSGHVQVRNLLAAAYPGFSRLEEEAVIANVDGRLTKLFIDFLLPDFKVAIEVHGRQHSNYVPHFHGTPEGFAAQQRRDRGKAQAIRDAKYALLVIYEDDLVSLTRAHLMKRIKKATQEITS